MGVANSLFILSAAQFVWAIPATIRYDISPQAMVYGIRYKVYGTWYMVGLWSLVSGGIGISTTPPGISSRTEVSMGICM